jgi:anaerobic magnesium-protoporphyrin IX monomethyl ester cyclase
MNILFVDLYNQFNDPHGIHSLCTVLKHNGHAVRYISSRNFRKALSLVTSLQPELILYSAFSANMDAYVRFDRLVKDAHKCHSIIGGPGPTFDSSPLKGSTIDAFCIGEGETALIDYINSSFQGSKNIVRSTDERPTSFYPLVDLDLLPVCDRSTVYDCNGLLKNTQSKQFFSGRGCPYECTYCFNHLYKKMFKQCGSYIRKKSVDHLMEEIKRVRDHYPLNLCVFNDDTFILNKKWLAEFAERMPKEIGLKYSCNVRANLVTEDIVRLLKESGCAAINWSIESGNDRLRNEVLKRGMKRDQILMTADLLNKYGLRHRIGNVIALPGETKEEMFETLELNIRCRPNIGLANILVPFPGLAITEYAIAHGCLDEHDLGHLPKDYFSKTVMHVPEDEKRFVYKLMCLFPFLVDFPLAYRNLALRRIVFALPRILIRIIYELTYVLKMSKMYSSSTSLRLKLLMFSRYVSNLMPE